MISLNNPTQYVQIICTDNSGCSFIRLRWNALYIQSFVNTNIIPIVTNVVLGFSDILARTKAIIWQRPLDLETVKQLKVAQSKFKFKMIAEFDDCIWEKIPEYNTNLVTYEKNKEQLRQILPYFDTIMVSTDYMKHNMEKTFSLSNIVTVENAIPKFLYSLHRRPLTEDLKKPHILWAGANQHFRNPVSKTNTTSALCGLQGDWTNKWINFIIDNVKNDKIDFTIMGGIFPYFFEEIKDKVRVIPWVDTNTFPRIYASINPDFVFAPLANNEFNKHKSNLAYLQACALGAVFIGSKFDNSPYENTITVLDDFWKYTKKDEYNKIVEYQDEYMKQSGGYLESSTHLNKFLSIMDNSDI